MELCYNVFMDIDITEDLGMYYITNTEQRLADLEERVAALAALVETLTECTLKMDMELGDIASKVKKINPSHKDSLQWRSNYPK